MGGGDIFGFEHEKVDPNEQARLEKQREAQAESLKPENKTTLEVWHEGKKYAMPYREFVEKHGDPRKYNVKSLIKCIVNYDLNKSLGL